MHKHDPILSQSWIQLLRTDCEVVEQLLRGVERLENWEGYNFKGRKD